jgi:DNA-binding response OmpR family regulator
VRLWQQDADLLLLFLLRRGELIPRIDIIEMLWPNPDAAPDYESDCCRTLISRLRKKCGVTINVWWGRGYSMPLPSEPFEQRKAA